MSQPPPPGSIIERFRGTEWATPEPAPPPPPPRRRGPLLVGLAFVAGIVTLVAVVLLGPGFNNGGGTGIRVSFLPDDGVTPRVPESMRILDAYWELVRDPELAYHLEGTGSSKAEGFDTSFELSLDIVGDDYAGKVNTIGGSGKADMIRADHVMYVRLEGREWVAIRTDDAFIRQTPFMGLEGRRELVYDEALTEGGRTVHRLRTTDFYAPSIERMLDLSQFNLEPAEVSLELIVDDEGVPLRASFSCLVTESPADGIPGFVGTAEYVFSDFGEPAPIATPAL